MDKLVCAYCGAEQQEVIFAIGASDRPDWTMVEGTGKITCPICYPAAMAEGKAAIDRFTCSQCGNNIKEVKK